MMMKKKQQPEGDEKEELEEDTLKNKLNIKWNAYFELVNINMKTEVNLNLVGDGWWEDNDLEKKTTSAGVWKLYSAREMMDTKSKK